MDWFSLKKKKLSGNTKIFMPDDPAPSLEKLESDLSALYEMEDLLACRTKLEKFITHELAESQKLISHPDTPADKVTFYRGAFWFAEKIFEKLDYVEKEIDRKEARLDEERKKQDADVGVGIVETAVR